MNIPLITFNIIGRETLRQLIKWTNAPTQMN